LILYLAMFDALGQDLRHAVHRLAGHPLLTTSVILTLALTIGANGALFSVLNAILLRSLPVRDPSQLVVLSLTDVRGQSPRLIYIDTFTALRAHQHVFESMCLYSGGGQLTTEARGALTPATIEGGTPEYYELLGVHPFLGRFITADDAPPVGEAAPVAVISYRFWKRQYGGDADAIGERLVVDGMPLTIIGITPSEFTGLYVDSGSDVSVPMGVMRRVAGDPKRPIRGWNILGRLRRGVTLDQANAEILKLWPSIQAATVPPGLIAREQQDFTEQQIHLDSLSSGFSPLRTRYANPLVILVALTSALLLLGCVNLSGLLLARSVDREYEFAICVALGASRRRLIQELLVESLLLSTSGTMAALPLAWWASQALSATMWTGILPLAHPMTPDGRVLGLMAGVAMATGTLMGVLPAWYAGRQHDLVELQRGRTIAHPTARWGQGLLVGQVALALVLLVGAGLFIRSLAKLRGIDAGYRTGGVTWTRLTGLPGGYQNFDATSYYPALMDRLSTILTVQSVALAHYFPAYFNFSLGLEPIARADAPAVTVAGLMESVSPRFFATLGIRLFDGRDFTWHDTSHTPSVTILNATLASRLFPSGNPIGQRIEIGIDGKRRNIEIVGVVADAVIVNLRPGPHIPIAFRPLLQEPQYARVPDVIVRATADPRTVGSALQRAVPALGHEYSRRTYSLNEAFDQSLLQERMLAALGFCFAVLAMLLASMGVYALLAYAVARRMREIGIRMALGSSAVAVVRLMLRRVLLGVAVGIVLGVMVSLWAGRFVSSMLYATQPYDWAALAGAVATLALTGLLAAWLPARRAARVDALIAIRAE
jgi:predicted permease